MSLTSHPKLRYTPPKFRFKCNTAKARFPLQRSDLLATEVFHKLSLMRRLVISMGGGAVMRPINWKYMHKGVSVWLDVPVGALARRIAVVGTNSHLLLHYEAGDAYTRDAYFVCDSYLGCDVKETIGF